MTPDPAPILVDDREGVRRLTLHRPDSLNAFDGAMFDALRAALDEAAGRDDLRCVAVTGSGRAFSSGSALAEPQADGGAPATAGPDPYDAFMATLQAFPKPLVAAVNGLAVGIATTLLGHCDLVLAAASARFRVPFASLGLVPEAGSTVTLPALLGRQAAAHALFTGTWLSAEEAARRGLVWRVVADDELAAAARATCAEIAAMPVESLVATKQLLLAARLPEVIAAREREEPEFRRLLAGPAHQEALRAFQQRRREKAA